MDLLQIATDITKGDDYYKLRQYTAFSDLACLHEKIQHGKELGKPHSPGIISCFVLVPVLLQLGINSIENREMVFSHSTCCSKQSTDSHR